MIGVVTHSYPNGSFDVFFPEGQFGAKGFSKAAPTGERFEPGDQIDCQFSPGGRGTVIKAVRVTAEQNLPEPEAGVAATRTGKPTAMVVSGWRGPIPEEKAETVSMPKDASQMRFHLK